MITPQAWQDPCVPPPPTPAGDVYEPVVGLSVVQRPSSWEEERVQAPGTSCSCPRSGDGCEGRLRPGWSHPGGWHRCRGGDCVTGNRSELPASRSSACGTQSGPAVHHLGQLLPCLAQSWVCRAPVPRQTHPHIHAFQHLVFIYQYTRDHAAPHISIYTLNNLVFEPNGGQQSCWEIASLVGLVTGTSRPSRVQLSRWLDQKLECGLTRMLPGHLLVKYSRHVGQEQGPGADSGEGGEINCFLAGLGTCLSRRCGSSSAMKKKV